MCKITKEFRIQGYSNFKCIADKCKFTCCAGWDVNVDEEIYNKWKNHNKGYILDNIMKIDDEEQQYFINKETHEVCPFLDKKGLCNIVKKDGEEYLSLTCRSFPRIENVLGSIKELTLSCACPEVVEIISNINNKINMISESDDNLQSDLEMFKIRQLLVYIVEEYDFSLDKKLSLCYELLLNLVDAEDKNQVLEKYKDIPYIKEFCDDYDINNIDINEAMEEVKYLFLDITENYKDVYQLENVLKEICTYASVSKDIFITEKWNKFNDDFKKYNKLIENFIVFKIFSSCLNEDIEEILLSFQLIILEYILVRYATFLKWSIHGEIAIEDIKDFIVIFSRVISNNENAVFEFLEDGFGDSILEYGYIRFILM